MLCLPDGRNSFTICLAVSIGYQRWTDTQADGRTDILPQRRPRYAYASRGNKMIYLKFDLINLVGRGSGREQSGCVCHYEVFRPVSLRPWCRLLSPSTSPRHGFIVSVVRGVGLRRLHHTRPDLTDFTAGHHQRHHLLVLRLGLAL